MSGVTESLIRDVYIVFEVKGFGLGDIGITTTAASQLLENREESPGSR